MAINGSILTSKSPISFDYDIIKEDKNQIKKEEKNVLNNEIFIKIKNLKNIVRDKY